MYRVNIVLRVVQNILYHCAVVTLQQGVAIVPQGVGGASQETG